MPELPEVETVRRDLQRLTLQRPIISVTIHRPQTVTDPAPDLFCQQLVGRQFSHWQRRGKYLLGWLDNQSCLGIHLRMTGQLLWLPNPQTEPLSRHTRLVLHHDQGAELRFVDLRTFGRMWLVPAGVSPAAVIPTLGTLGPEPLSSDFTPASLQTGLSRRQSPIKSALLDQRLLAGIGNIYADEALFLAQIHPLTAGASLTMGQIQALHQALIQVLEDSLSQRGTTFSAYRDLDGVNGNYLGQAWAYQRTGQPCRRCAEGMIARLKIAGRSSHFCPVCQPAPRFSKTQTQAKSPLAQPQKASPKRQTKKAQTKKKSA